MEHCHQVRDTTRNKGRCSVSLCLDQLCCAVVTSRTKQGVTEVLQASGEPLWDIPEKNKTFGGFCHDKILFVPSQCLFWPLWFPVKFQDCTRIFLLIHFDNVVKMSKLPTSLQKVPFFDAPHIRPPDTQLVYTGKMIFPRTSACRTSGKFRGS